MGILTKGSAKDRAKAHEAIEAGGRYAVIPVTDQRVAAGTGQWNVSQEGVELMNELAAEGWLVVGTAGHAVVMERPTAYGKA